jgi:adenylate cyclase
MAQEIERKFLVTGAFRDAAISRTRIVQGYLSSVPERTVRVRIKDGQGFLTIKGIGNASGASRFEWEREIPLTDAEQLLAICEPGVIDKVRHLVPVGAHTFEVDEFHGANEGLVIAEVELSSETDALARPPWLGDEVTGDARYYNSMLMKRPFSEWTERSG